MRFYCQPCDHKWWQHRHPDKRIRDLAFALMCVGLVLFVSGLVILLGGN